MVQVLDALSEELSLAQGLYDLTRGSRTKITLECYVLGVLLDEVAEAANHRLLEMSHRRYSLHRMKETGAANKGGLSLEVSDSYTGRSRPANTLLAERPSSPPSHSPSGLPMSCRQGRAAYTSIPCSSTKALARWIRKH